MYHRIGKDGIRYWGKKGAGYLFTDGTALLLLKRDEKGDNKGKWTGPGGKHEKGETLIDTAQRETKEEIGFMPKCQRITHFDNKDGLHLFRNYLCMVSNRFEAKLSDEHSDYDWVNLEEIDKVDLHPGLKKIMDRVIDRINSRHMKSFSEWIHS